MGRFNLELPWNTQRVSKGNAHLSPPSDYLTPHPHRLKRLFIVIDPIAGIKDTDKQIMKILDQQPLSYQVVLTKRDRMTDEAFNKAKAEIEQYLVKHAICCYPELLSTGMRRKSKSKAKDEARYEDDITRVRWSILKAAGIKPKGA